MNVIQGITFGITCAGFALGLVIKVASLSMKFGQMTQSMESNKERDKEEREKVREKFAELYTRTSTHDSLIAVLVEKIDGIKEDTKDIKDVLRRREEDK